MGRRASRQTAAGAPAHKTKRERKDGKGNPKIDPRDRQTNDVMCRETPAVCERTRTRERQDESRTQASVDVTAPCSSLPRGVPSQRRRRRSVGCGSVPGEERPASRHPPPTRDGTHGAGAGVQTEAVHTTLDRPPPPPPPHDAAVSRWFGNGPAEGKGRDRWEGKGPLRRAEHRTQLLLTAPAGRAARRAVARMRRPRRRRRRRKRTRARPWNARFVSVPRALAAGRHQERPPPPAPGRRVCTPLSLSRTHAHTHTHTHSSAESFVRLCLRDCQEAGRRGREAGGRGGRQARAAAPPTSLAAHTAAAASAAPPTRNQAWGAQGVSL